MGLKLFQNHISFGFPKIKLASSLAGSDFQYSLQRIYYELHWRMMAQHVSGFIDGKNLKTLDLSHCCRIDGCFLGNCQYVAFVGCTLATIPLKIRCNFKQFVFSSQRWIELCFHHHHPHNIKSSSSCTQFKNLSADSGAVWFALNYKNWVEKSGWMRSST